jgi:hypothetical protein
VFCKFVEVVLGEIDAALFLLLDLLQQWPILLVHLVVDLVELGYAIFVVLLGHHKFVLAVNTRIHRLLNKIFLTFALLLVEESSFDHDFVLLACDVAVLELKLALVVFYALLMQIMQQLLGPFERLIVRRLVVLDVHV